MKARALIKKILIYGIIAAMIMAVGYYLYSKKVGGQEPSYTSYSSKKDGIKALYLLTNRMGYYAERYERSARFLPDGATMVAVQPDTARFEREDERKYLKKWLEKGNTMLLLTDSDISADELGLEEFSEKSPYELEGYNYGLVYEVGSGSMVLIPGCDEFTNEGLKPLEPGVAFIDVVEQAGNKLVLFNEYYHGYGSEGISIWDLLGPNGELVAIQLFIGLAVLMFVLSRRFGKPVTVFEIIKRAENEKLLALSNMYMKAGANDLVLEVCFDDFKKQLAKYLGLGAVYESSELIAASKGNNRLEKMNAGKVMEACEGYIKSGSRDTRELVQLVSKLEEIRKGILV